MAGLPQKWQLQNKGEGRRAAGKLSRRPAGCHIPVAAGQTNSSLLIHSLGGKEVGGRYESLVLTTKTQYYSDSQPGYQGTLECHKLF